MGMDDFWASLPTGKEDKPLLFEMGPLVYDFHDIDGLYYMLDRKLSGCLVMMWAKPMNPGIRGKVTLDGREVTGWVNQYMEVMGKLWVLGIPLRGLVTEYGKEYRLHVEGFTDIDGNEMNPQDFTVKGVDKTEPKPEDAEHERIALKAAQEGIVLLKNEGNALPINKGETLNLFGKGVHEFRIGAAGAGKINPHYSIHFVEAVRQRSHEKGDYVLNEELVEFYGCDRDSLPPDEVMDRAKELSDTAIIFLTRAAGENQDASAMKGEYYLSDEEEALIAKVTQIFSKTIVILNVGYPIDVTFADKYHVAGLVYSGFGGMLAGPALLNVLAGDVNPSGKLPDTWALDYQDIPSSKNFYDCRVNRAGAVGECPNGEDTVYLDTCYEEDIYVGYRYFTTFGKAPAYPFGYGLSYTCFSIEGENPVFDGNTFDIDIHVTNTGAVPGKEVVQIYIGKPESELEQPVKELAAFEKTRKLQPGETQSFHISIPAENLVSFDTKRAAYILSKGTYDVYVGNSVEAPRVSAFAADDTKVIRQVENLLSCGQQMTLLSKKDRGHTYPKGECSGEVKGKKTFLPYQKRKAYPADFTAEKSDKKITFANVRKDLSLAESFAAQLSQEELARLSICASAGWGMEGIGEAGRVYKTDGYIPDFPVSDGNSGVNLNRKNIGMPSSVTICASFNKELSEEVGRVIGEEAKALGIPLILAPAFNIHRNPLNGRQPEYFSEDPYLSGVMAGVYAKGMESAGTGSCYKHLLGNNCESSRKRNQSVISERAIREIYFRTFEYALRIHMPASVMTAYNAVNGCPTAADEELIQGLLRRECGFGGFVMTDWTTYDTVDVASMVQAGNCWITPGSNDDTYTALIREGIENGTVDPMRLRENVTALIRTMARFA